MALQGKGFFIWNIINCEHGNPEAIASAAQAAGFSHVLIKIADGNYTFNLDKKTHVDLVPPVVDALRRRNIQAWGWHYVYGFDPLGESRIAIRRIEQLGLDGYVIDAEGEYKEAGRAAVARRFMKEMRSALPNLPMALSSYRFPSYHPQLPWREFLERCDYNMPQVYWEKSHNPASQMTRVMREFQAINPFRPVIPTGPAYKWNGWQPTVADMTEFLEACRAARLTAVNFFSWDECRRDLMTHWDLITRFPLGGPVPPAPQPTPQPEPPKDIVELLIQALNLHELEPILDLYRPEAVHINAARTIQGRDAIRTWYETFLRDQLPGASFNLTGFTGFGPTRRLTWRASSDRARIDNGSDTLGLLNGKIIYHYTSYSVI